MADPMSEMAQRVRELRGVASVPGKLSDNINFVLDEWEADCKRLKEAERALAGLARRMAEDEWPSLAVWEKK
jgi:hypothetical protein